MLENLTNKQKKIIITVGIVVLIGVIYFIYNKFGNVPNISESEEILISDSNSSYNTSTNETNSSEDIIVVHIAGAVKNPGIVKLKEGSRLEDAIEIAGGLTEDADISNVNLAYVLDDGTKIIIPNRLEQSEGVNIISEDAGENIILEESSYGSSNTSKSLETVNINRATEAELETLSRNRTIPCK